MSIAIYNLEQRKEKSETNVVKCSLATVNAFLFCVGATQVTRILMYNQSVKGTSPLEEIKDVAKEQAAVVEGAVKDPKGAVKNAEKV